MLELSVSFAHAAGFVYLFRDFFLRGMYLVMFYPLLFMAYVSATGEEGRLIAVWSGHYSAYFPRAFWMYFFSVTAFFLPFLPVRNRTFSVPRLRVSFGFYAILVLLFFMASIVAYPWVFSLSAHRESILPGNAWNSFYLVLFVILIIGFSPRFRLLLLGAIAAASMVVVYGERADSAMMLVLAAFFLLTATPRVNKLSPWQWGLFAISVSVLLVGLLVVGELRDKGEVVYSTLPSKLLSHPTVADATHVFYSALWYRDGYGTTLDPILNILYSLIPFHPLGGAGSPHSPPNLLKPYMANAGGGLFVTGFYLAGGVPLALLGSFTLGFAVQSLWTARALLWQAAFLVVFLLSFRVFWYGPFYVVKPIYVLILCLAAGAFATRAARPFRHAPPYARN